MHGRSIAPYIHSNTFSFLLILQWLWNHQGGGWDGVGWGGLGVLGEEAELQQQADEGSDAVDRSALEEQAVKLAAAAAAAQDVRLLQTQRR